MTTLILGGGLAGISLASFLKNKSIILERENQIGGLCKSFDFDGIKHDIGPHILFSKNRRMLDVLLAVVQTNRVKRSSKIFHKGRFIKYPFENELSALSVRERDYCLHTFLNNPYKNIKPKNMLEFFLKTFGEGITKLYLKPYNEKIWKYPPNLMDTQIVERIPRPPDKDIIKSAGAVSTEGYRHQLYFHYPVSGGIAALVGGFADKAKKNTQIITGVKIRRIQKYAKGWKVYTSKGVFNSKRLINSIPLHELFKYLNPPAEVKQALDDLKYNSIYITALKVKKDNMGSNYVVNFADKKTIFHRISKVGFLGKNYRYEDKTSCLVAETTCGNGSLLSKMNKSELSALICDDLHKTGLISKKDILKTKVRKFKYAYVIYDLNHKKNVSTVMNYLKSAGVYCCGRFAEFKYLNMDAVVSGSFKLAGVLGCKK